MKKTSIVGALALIIGALMALALHHQGVTQFPIFGPTAAKTGSPLSTGPSASFATASQISQAEDAYFAKNGGYVQVEFGDKLPDGSDTVLNRLGVDMPTNMRVDIYVTPKGERGYKIITDDGATITSVGVGPEAAKDSYAYPYKTATTTP